MSNPNIVDGTGALLPDDTDHQRHRKRMEENLRSVLAHDPDSLVRMQELGEKFALIELRPMIYIIQDHFLKLQSANTYHLIGPKRLGEIGVLVEQVKILFDEIANFDPGDNHLRSQFGDRCRRAWTDCSVLLQPYLAFHAAWSDSIQSLPTHVDAEFNKLRSDLAEEARKLSHDWEEEGRSKLAQVDTALARVEQVEATVRAAAEQAGINAQAKFFQDEAQHHNWWSIGWFTVLLMASGTAAYYIVKVFEPQLMELARTAQQKNEPLHVMVASLASRIAVLSMLWFVVLWCAKNFTAHRHNVVVNRHRHNAISSFRAFAEGDQVDPATKNAILLSATQSVFTPQSSGYLKGDSDLSQSPTAQIIEVFRGVAKGGAKD